LSRIGEPSRFACPECHGVLLQLEGGSRIRFRYQTDGRAGRRSAVARDEIRALVGRRKPLTARRPPDAG